MSRFGCPDPGDIIQIGRHAYRVEAAVESSDEYEIDVEILTGPNKGEKAHATANKRKHLLRRLDEHFSVCHCCGEVPPCLASEQDRYAREQAQLMAKRMAVPDGCCMACSEPISTRQKTLWFPGTNVWNPFGAPGVRFHARRGCRSTAARYEEAWIAAEEGRERSTLTLKCTGSVIVHEDGTAECLSRNDGSECPSIHAWHGYIGACHASSHGCGRGCSPDQHPGARVAEGLTHDGYWPLS